MSDVVGRLAPTPSGDLHLGNIVAFAAAWLSVRSVGGTLLLRMEDVDRSRSRREVEDRQREDLEWLGLTWDRETLPQRDRDYPAWLQLLDTCYFCKCTRRTIAAGGNLHPLSCRSEGHTDGAIRFPMPDADVPFVDRVHGARSIRPLSFGDPVLRRRDGVFTYSLAVVADDIADGVTEVVRGADLLDYTAVQSVLWSAFGATPPTWLHSPLVNGPDGRKLAKSYDAVGIRALREAGVAREQILATVLRWLGQEPDAFETLTFDSSRVPTEPIQLEDGSAGWLS